MSEEVKTDLIPVGAKDMIKGAVEYCESVRELKISTDDENENAAMVLAELKKHVKDLDSTKKEITDPWKSKSKIVDGEFKVPTDAVKNVIAVISKEMGRFQTEKLRKERAEQARLQAIADEKRRKAEEAARKEQEKIDKYEAEGKAQAAAEAEARRDANLEKAANVVAPVVEDSKPTGTSYVETYIGTVRDHKKAIASIVAQEYLHGFLTVDMKGLERMRKQIGDNLKIDGITFEETRSVRSRS